MSGLARRSGKQSENGTSGVRRNDAPSGGDLRGNAAAAASVGAAAATVGGPIGGVLGAVLQGAANVARVAGQAAAGAQAYDVPALGSNTTVTAATVRTALANNPRALSALDTLTGDTAFQALTAEQQGDLLAKFQATPNAATGQYLRGVAAFHTNEDKAAGYEAFEQLRDPDSGTVTLDGVTYTVANGDLVGEDGQVVGDIRTDGTWKLTEDERRSSVYDDLHASVDLREGDDRLLSLHDADPNGKLTHDGMNDTFTDRVDSTLLAARRENIDMRVTDGFRSFQDQDALYAQGRTAPGNRVTGARGGQSWHNYGLGVDATFMDQNGTPHWQTTGEYADLWDRYGELGEQNGLTWGGNWNTPDRPHLEYHPGLGDSDAGTLSGTLRRDGLEAAWDRMGIGEEP